VTVGKTICYIVLGQPSNVSFSYWLEVLNSHSSECSLFFAHGFIAVWYVIVAVGAGAGGEGKAASL